MSPSTTVGPVLTVKGAKSNTTLSQVYYTNYNESESKEYDEVTIHPDYLDQKIRIVNQMPASMREKMVYFLLDHLRNFAWRTGNISEISLDIVEHRLNIDPTFKSIRQKS